MDVEETVSLSQEEIRYQLGLYAIHERSKPYVEWGCGLFAGLINAHVQGINDDVLLEKGERPDFRISFPSLQKSLHIEVTMAASKAHQAALRIMLRDPDVTHIEPATYSAAPSLETRHMGIGIGRKWQPLRGRGWAGSEAESQWVNFIDQAVQKKVLKYYDYGFDQLMIFDDSPVCGWINAYMAVRMIRRKPDPDLPFVVNIWSGNSFISDLYGECRLYGIEKMHLTEAYFPYVQMNQLDAPGKGIIHTSKFDKNL